MPGPSPFSSPYAYDSPQPQHGSHRKPGPPEPHGARGPLGTPVGANGSATDLVRWAAFSCLLVPVVLIGYGIPAGGAVVTAAGLAVVTVVCRLLLRRSERIAARDRDPGRDPDEDLTVGTHRGRHSRTGAGTHRGGRKADS